MTKKIKNQGFTLIELLVVITIIGVLAGLLLANFVGVRERAADVKRKNDVNQLKKALRLYYNDYQHYPPEGGSNSVAGCGSAGTSGCGTSFEAGSGGVVYMKEFPQEYEYYSDADESFVIRVELDNQSDESAAQSETTCSSAINSLIGPSLSDSSAVYYYVCED